MAQLDTQILPLLPLTSGVVLPGMVVTLTIESDEARRASPPPSPRRRAPARAPDRLELREDRHRRQGGGRGPAPQRPRSPRDPGMVRAVVGPASPAPARPRGCSSSPVPTPTSLRARRELARGTARCSRTSSRRAACPRWPSSSAGSPTPGRSPTRRVLAGPVDRAEGRGPRDPRRRTAARGRCWTGRRRSWPSSS